MQITAVKSLPLGFSQEEKNRKTESNECPVLKLIEKRKFLAAYIVMHTGGLLRFIVQLA